MIAFLAAMQLAPAQPVKVMPRPMILPPAAVARPTDRQRMSSDARALLARAEAVRQGYRPTAGQPTRAELDASIEQVKQDLDSMSEMGEMESLRLQMAMDRMSKMMSTLSNILKKISDTGDTITNNIK